VRWKGIGVRIEDDVLCTTREPDVLTAAIPKEIGELEALVGSEGLVRV
jgi:Xaa-Pro aminopeptidase